jgi:hypothetical protein
VVVAATSATGAAAVPLQKHVAVQQDNWSTIFPHHRTILLVPFTTEVVCLVGSCRCCCCYYSHNVVVVLWQRQRQRQRQRLGESFYQGTAAAVRWCGATVQLGQGLATTTTTTTTHSAALCTMVTGFRDSRFFLDTIRWGYNHCHSCHSVLRQRRHWRRSGMLQRTTTVQRAIQLILLLLPPRQQQLSNRLLPHCLNGNQPCWRPSATWNKRRYCTRTMSSQPVLQCRNWTRAYLITSANKPPTPTFGAT